MHDVIRDFAIASVEPDQLKQNHRKVVRLLRKAMPTGGWSAASTDDALSAYVVQALGHHLRSSMSDNPGVRANDAEAIAWCADPAVGVYTRSFWLRCAAPAVGSQALLAAAEQAEAESDHWRAGLLLLATALTEEYFSLGFQYDPDGAGKHVDMLHRGLAQFSTPAFSRQQTRAQRTYEAMVHASVTNLIPWSDPRNTRFEGRKAALIRAGLDPPSSLETATLLAGMAVSIAFNGLGVNRVCAGNHLDRAGVGTACMLLFDAFRPASQLLVTTTAIGPERAFAIICSGILFCCNTAVTWSCGDIAELFSVDDILRPAIEHFDFDSMHLQITRQSTAKNNRWLYMGLHHVALLRSGDVELALAYLTKKAAIHEAVAASGGVPEPASGWPLYTSSLSLWPPASWHERAVPAVAALGHRLVHSGALGGTFDGVDIHLENDSGNFSWRSDDGRFVFCSRDYLADFAKLAHFLCANAAGAADEVDEERVRALLPAPGVFSCPRTADGGRDPGAMAVGCYDIFVGQQWLGPFVDFETLTFEVLGQLGDAIKSASIWIERFPHNRLFTSTLHSAVARCTAAQLQPGGDAAAVADRFDRAVADAAGGKAFLLQLLAERDRLELEVAAFFGAPDAGRTQATLAAIGRALLEMGIGPGTLAGSKAVAFEPVLFSVSGCSLSAALEAVDVVR